MPMLALLSFVAMAAPVEAFHAAGRNVVPFPIRVESLPNGMRILMVPFDSPGLVAYDTVVRVGSRNEVEKGHSGFAHFFEHMMFRGTDKHPKEAYDSILSKRGVSNNATTTDDITCYTTFGPSSALPMVIDLESDRIQNLKYTAEDFATESKAVLGEYNSNFSDPAQKMDEVLRDLAYSAHTYKHTTMGFLADIEAMPKMYDYSVKFFRKFYTPDNTSLVVVGDFDADKVLLLIRQFYGGWKLKAQDPKVPAEPPQKTERHTHIDWNSPTQPRMVVAFHTPPASTKGLETAAQNLLGPYLFGPTSPLYKDLILDRQVAQSMDYLYADHRDPFLFEVLFTLKSDEAADPARLAFDKSVEELAQGRVDEKRLSDIRSNLRYSLIKSFDSAENVAAALAWSLGPTGEPDYLNRLYDGIDRVDGATLSAFAKSYLVSANETSVTLTGRRAGGQAASESSKAGLW
jgi:zinc protease